MSLSVSAESDRPPAVELNPGDLEFSLKGYISALEDVSGELSIEEVTSSQFAPEFRRLPPELTSFGNSRSVFWLRFTITNNSDNTNWYVQHHWPNTHFLDLYWRDSESGEFQAKLAGSMRPPEERDIPHRRISFQLPLNPGETNDFYLKLDSEAVSKINLTVLHQTQLWQLGQAEMLRLGIFYGGLLLLALGNLLLYAYFRQPSQLWLFAFMTSLTVGISVFEGVLPLFLGLHSVYIIQYGFMATIGFCLFALVAFSRVVLKTQNTPKIDKFCRFLQLSCAVPLLLNVLLGYSFAPMAFFVIGFTLILFLFVHSAMQWFAGLYPVRFYTIGLMTFLSGFVINTALIFGLLPTSFVVADAIRIGVILMGVLFSLSFADLVSWLADQKELATRQRQAAERKFKAIFEQSFQISALLSASGEVLEMNKTAEQSELLSDPQLTGKKFWDINAIASSATIRGFVKRQWDHAINGDERQFELNFNSAEKGEVSLYMSLKPFLNEKRRIEFIVLEARDVTSTKRMSRAITELSRGLSGVVGNVFFRRLVLHLSQMLQVRVTLMAELIAGSDEMQTLSMVDKGQIVENRIFDLKNSPFEKVVTSGTCIYEQDVQSLFPNNPALAEIMANGFVGLQLKDGEQKVVGMLVLIHDKPISVPPDLLEILSIFSNRAALELERLKSHQSLYRTQQRLSLHFKNTPLGVVEFDLDLKVIDWNIAAESIFKVSRADMIGQSVSMLLPEKNMSQRALKERFLNPQRRVFTRMENVTLKGEKVICDWYGTLLFDENGLLSGVAALVANVTIEERAIQTLKIRDKDQQEILNSLPDGVIVVDSMGTILSTNHASDKLFNAVNQSLLDNNIRQLIPKGASGEAINFVTTYLKARQTKPLTSGVQLTATKRSGESFPVRVNIAELSPDGERQRFICFIHDLTLIQQQEQLIRRNQKMNALGKLTGGIAHDFNNLIGIIQGYAELLSWRVEAGTKQERYASEILKASKRGAQMTDKLLAFSKGAGASPGRVDLNQVLREQLQLLEKTLTPRIELRLDTSGDVWPVHIDRSEFCDALLNLSINAMHAIEGNGKLTLHTSNLKVDDYYSQIIQLPSGDYVLFSISDSGIGMDDETQDRIFDPFFTTKGEQGTGLGLSQVYGFVERSNGQIQVKSSPGGGTTFLLFFPRCLEDTVEASEDNQLNPIASELVGTETILLVDDEEALLEFAETLFQYHGYQVFTATSGRQAIDILHQNAIDIVVSDVIMPEMDGYELAAYIRQHFPAIIIQLVSGFADDRHKEAKDEILKEQLLSKPYQGEQILIRVRELLDKSNANSEHATFVPPGLNQSPH